MTQPRDADPTQPLPTVSSAQQQTVVVTRPPRRRRPGLVGGIVILVVLVLVVVAAIVGENVARSVVIQQVKSKAASFLRVPNPDDVSVDLGSGSILLQLAKNRLDSVKVRATHADIEGLDATVTGDGAGIPVFSQGRIQRARLTVQSTGAQITKRIEAAYPQLKGLGGTVTLGDGRIGVGLKLSVFGQSIPVAITAKPGVSNGRPTFSITGAKLGSNAISVTQLETIVPGVKQLLSGASLCIADQLPKAVKLTSVTVGDGTLRYGLDADGVVLDQATLNDKGTCS